MDRYDVEILEVLQADGRITWLQLAEQIHLSPAACQRRVQALVEQDVIEKFTVQLNATELGNEVRAFISVNVERQNIAKARAFRHQVLTYPEVQACYMLTGSVDFLLDVVAPDIPTFGRFMEQNLLALPGVKDASSSIVLEPIKELQTMIPRV